MSQVNNTPILFEKEGTKSIYTDRIISPYCVPESHIIFFEYTISISLSCDTICIFKWKLNYGFGKY